MRKKFERSKRSTTERNVDAVSAMEREALDQRSVPAQVVEIIVAKAGQSWFAGLNLVFFAGWNDRGLMPRD